MRYNKHIGFFTRVMRKFPLSREDGVLHPKVYVGKNSNSNYNDDGGIGGCLYWQDYCNTDNSGKVLRLWKEGVLQSTGSDKD